MTRPRTSTIVSIVVLVAVLGIYLSVDVQIHFFLHLFLGGTAALLVGGIVGVITGRFAPAVPVITVGALVNAVPDVLYLFFHVAHRPWMDIFQWHIEAHFMPGFPVSWYLIFLLALAAYLFAQGTPGLHPVVRGLPLLALVAAIWTAVMLAHERIPAGLMPGHHGFLIGWASPAVAVAVLVPLLRRPTADRVSI